MHRNVVNVAYRSRRWGSSFLGSNFIADRALSFLVVYGKPIDDDDDDDDDEASKLSLIVYCTEQSINNTPLGISVVNGWQTVTVRLHPDIVPLH